MRSLASAALLLALTAPALAAVLPASIAQPALRVAPRCALAEKAKTKLTSQHCASIATFLNDNFEAELLEWTLAKTEVGKTSRGKNMFSGGSWKPRRSVVEALDGEKLTLDDLLQPVLLDKGPELDHLEGQHTCPG